MNEITPTAEPIATLQVATRDSKELRGLMKRIAQRVGDTRWSGYASPATQWNLTFFHIVPGRIGLPDVRVTVNTDIAIGFTGKPGTQIAFSDSQPVNIPAATAVRLDTYDLRTVCALFLAFDRVSLTIRYGRGSTHSSAFGIGIVSLCANFHGLPAVVIRDTITVDGRVVCSGIVDLER